METCTVAALDAITAFAVPNPNCSSQSQSVFSGLVALRLPRLADHPAYFGLAKFCLSQPFQPSTEANLNSYLIHVNAILAAVPVICGCCCGKARPIAEITARTLQQHQSKVLTSEVPRAIRGCTPGIGLPKIGPISEKQCRTKSLASSATGGRFR